MVHQKKFMRGLYSRHPSLQKSAEYVDCVCINIANKDFITYDFKLLLKTLVRCNCARLNSNGEVIQE